MSWCTPPPFGTNMCSFPQLLGGLAKDHSQLRLSHRLPWPKGVASLKVGLPVQRQFPPSDWLMPRYKDLPPASLGDVMGNFVGLTGQLWMGEQISG